MAQALPKHSNLERLPTAFGTTIVSDELRRITNLLRTIAPEATIGFEFDGSLRVNIDVRMREDVLVLQAMLPNLEAGLFRNATLGNTPSRSFGHRISAEVAR